MHSLNILRVVADYRGGDAFCVWCVLERLGAHTNTRTNCFLHEELQAQCTAQTRSRHACVAGILQLGPARDVSRASSIDDRSASLPAPRPHFAFMDVRISLQTGAPPCCTAGDRSADRWPA
eukprot:6844498-Prymnesium_polylepis.1